MTPTVFTAALFALGSAAARTPAPSDPPYPAAVFAHEGPVSVDRLRV